MEHPARGDAEAYRRYFAGMDASMDQKAAFLSAHLSPEKGARILDLGCGSGALSARLAILAPQASVAGIDIDPGTIAEAASAHVLPNLRFEVGDASAEQAAADAVVSCSLLHHVYTYAPKPYDDAAAEAALTAHIRSLRPGGILVLRDFCTDGIPDETCLLELPADPDGESKIAPLLRDFAARARPLDPAGSGFPLEDLGIFDGWRRFRLHRSWSAEFMLRKDYRTDWEAELREQYAFWSLRRFVRIVEAAGARVLRAAPVLNPWVVNNRFAGRVRRRNERGQLLPWPATNMVLVAQRLEAGGVLRLHEQRVDDEPPSYLRLNGWRHRDETSGKASIHDLAHRPTGAVEFLPYCVEDGHVRVLVRAAWPRPASVMMSRGGTAGDEIRSGHIVEMIALASDGEAPARDFRARSGLSSPEDRAFERLTRFLPSAGLADETVQAFAVAFPSLPQSAPAPSPEGMTLDHGELRSFDALGLLRAAEVGMLMDARLELAIRLLLRWLAVPEGAWIGEAIAVEDAASEALPQRGGWDAASASAGQPFQSAPPAGFLRLVRSLFQEVRSGSGAVATQALETIVPSRHDAWTVSVLPLLRDAVGTIHIGLERRELPAAQVALGDAALACVPAWRIEHLPEAADPLRAAAADLCGCEENTLTRLGAPYYPSLGISPERVQPFVIPASALSPERQAEMHFVPLAEILQRPTDIRDGHLLISMMRLGCAAA